jgi:DNA mismatch endonuclease, patch repair protein
MKVSDSQRSDLMRAIRSKNTQPELVLRRALHRAGYRYVLHASTLPGKPDIVLPRFSAVIEVRGCFWHGHTCSVGHIPKSNVAYWGPKLERTRRRDRRNVSTLRRMGYRVRVIWACEIDTDAKLASTLLKVLAWLQ